MTGDQGGTGSVGVEQGHTVGVFVTTARITTTVISRETEGRSGPGGLREGDEGVPLTDQRSQQVI